MSNVGNVVTVVTILGEIVGRCKAENDVSLTLESPRLFVPAQGDASGGFAPGLCMTGKVNLDEAVLNKSVLLTVVPSHQQIESGWREATSGVIV